MSRYEVTYKRRGRDAEHKTTMPIAGEPADACRAAQWLLGPDARITRMVRL